MLSKYYSVLDMNTGKADMRVYISALLCKLKKKYLDVNLKQTTPGGTLGIFFEATIDGKRKFIKTHPLGIAYRENLEKEIRILSYLYPQLGIERESVVVKEVSVTFLIMDYLFPQSSSVDAADICKYISGYQKKLAENPFEVNYTFRDIVNAGSEALESLYGGKFISEGIYKKCKESIINLEDSCTNKTVLCHGDLSNVNIMCNESGELFIIDWEDALIAFPEYDFLYWLTFYAQRKYYAVNPFKNSNIQLSWAKDVMVVIMLLPT